LIRGKGDFTADGSGKVYVHTSGHATVEDLKKFQTALNPKLLVPIHTFNAADYPRLFKGVKVLEDGEVLEVG